MSQYFQWLMLSAITGSPIGSAVFLLLLWFVVDRFTLGVLPDPVRWVMRRRREAQLNRTLLLNPHDARSRIELGQLLNERGAHRRALQVLRPALERGEEDAVTVFSMGWACVGAGFREQGEKLLAHLAELDPNFRLGEVDLVLGKSRLERGDGAGARQALERLVATRRGTVEGRVLLARALKAQGDDASAALMRDQAWGEYLTAPRFQRRKERLWAWRARPSRPLTYLLAIVLGLMLLGRFVAPGLTDWASKRQRQQRAGGRYYDSSLQSPDPDSQE